MQLSTAGLTKRARVCVKSAAQEPPDLLKRLWDEVLGKVHLQERALRITIGFVTSGSRICECDIKLFLGIYEAMLASLFVSNISSHRFFQIPVLHFIFHQ